MDYQQLHEQTTAQCRKYVEAFCRIMGWAEDHYMPEWDWVGYPNPDIFGIVCINDMFFSMSDLCTVIGELDHWKEKYGNDLPKVIEEWYYYHIGDSEKWGRETPTHAINLKHWLMGARPIEVETSDDYKQHQQKELAEAHRRTEQAKQDLFKAIEDEYHAKMSYHE